MTPLIIIKYPSYEVTFFFIFKVLGWRIKEGCAVLGPTGLILGSTQLEPSLDKGTSREGKINLIRGNRTVTPAI